MITGGVSGNRSNQLKLLRPGFHSRTHFGLEAVALVDPDYTRPAAGRMAEDILRDLDPRSEPLQPGRHRPPEIVQDPVGNA